MLPAELVDHIFSFLHKDIRALKRCSKAHPLYSRLAERHLYAHIVIDPLSTDSESEVDNLLENPRFLDYPRTVEIHGRLTVDRNPLARPRAIMLVIPQMANLISLSIYDPLTFQSSEEFYSTFRNCLQQSSFQELRLFDFLDFPFSVLDVAKSIKRLTLSDCVADEDEPISSSSSSQLSLETLILSGDHNPELHLRVMHWVTHLTTLELYDLWLDLDWTVFRELLAGCSNSLCRLHLGMGNRCYQEEFPFTLSALTHLKKLSISSLITMNAPRSEWALPEIIRVVNTAPAIQDLILRFHYHVSDFITSIGRLDWSLLNHLQSNFTGKCPRIDLCFTGEGTSTMGPTFCPESIPDALAENKALMDLVKRGLVILRSEPTSVWRD